MNVIELDFDFESFLDYYVIHDSHYFVFEEVSGTAFFKFSVKFSKISAKSLEKAKIRRAKYFNIYKESKLFGSLYSN